MAPKVNASTTCFQALYQTLGYCLQGPDAHQARFSRQPSAFIRGEDMRAPPRRPCQAGLPAIKMAAERRPSQYQVAESLMVCFPDLFLPDSEPFVRTFGYAGPGRFG